METFEELLSPQLDRLYAGALFLCGGAEARAEGLLTDTVGTAFRAFRRERPVRDFASWLDGKMVAVLKRWEGLDGATSANAEQERAARGRNTDAAGERGLSEALYQAASAMPVEARIAVWLVILRRWSYSDTADVLGVDERRLIDLLEARRALAPALGVTPGSRNASKSSS